jgi:hypothetical protein
VLALVSLSLVGLAGCNLPRAKLANLREVHQPNGHMSYRGNVQDDIGWALSALLSNTSVHVSGLEGLTGGDIAIEDPCGVDLENMNELAAADSDDILVSGLQVEAFGWLGPDDQYILGRERAVMELGHAAARLDVQGPTVAPEGAATPEDLSPVLAGLVRAGLGSLPPELEDEGFAQVAPELLESNVDLGAAIAAVQDLTLDRAGSLRALAVCDALFLRSDGFRSGDSAESHALRAFALELQAKITSLALGEALIDEAPLVRAAAYEALAGLPGGAPPGLLQLAATDPEVEVASRGLLYVARHGLPLERVPADERPDAEARWIDFLVGQAQAPQGRVSFAACAALSRAVPEGPGSLRPEEWTAWWRASHPGRDLPLPLVSQVPGSTTG